MIFQRSSPRMNGAFSSHKNVVFRFTLFKEVMSRAKVSSLFSDSEAYHEQMGLIPSSNESLDIGLSNAHA